MPGPRSVGLGPKKISTEGISDPADQSIRCKASSHPWYPQRGAQPALAQLPAALFTISITSVRCKATSLVTLRFGEYQDRQVGQVLRHHFSFIPPNLVQNAQRRVLLVLFSVWEDMQEALQGLNERKAAQAGGCLQVPVPSFTS